MDEPTYTYLKGQGWVITQCDAVSGITAAGRSFTILNRLPNAGEYFIHVYKHNPEYVIDSSLARIDKLAAWLSTARPNFEFLEKFSEDTKILIDYLMVTFVVHD